MRYQRITQRVNFLKICTHELIRGDQIWISSILLFLIPYCNLFSIPNSTAKWPNEIFLAHVQLLFCRHMQWCGSVVFVCCRNPALKNRQKKMRRSNALIRYISSFSSSAELLWLRNGAFHTTQHRHTHTLVISCFTSVSDRSLFVVVNWRRIISTWLMLILWQRWDRNHTGQYELISWHLSITHMTTCTLAQ